MLTVSGVTGGGRKHGALPPARAYSTKFIHPDLFSDTLEYLRRKRIICESTIVSLFNWGEPTIHPQFNDILRVLNELKQPYMVSTNSKNIIDLPDISLLNYCIEFRITMTGFSESSYALSNGFQFESTLQAIQENIRIVKQSPNTQRHISYLISKYSIGELADAQRFAKEMETDLRENLAFFNSLDYHFKYIKNEFPKRILDKAMRELFLPKIDLTHFQNTENHICSQFNILALSHEAGLSLCCGARLNTNEYSICNIDGLDLQDIQYIRLSHETCKLCTSLAAC